ncbi:arylamine N-acetyltransferase, pineal gland isozyme NAT-3-like [Clavelina lepadiformis]|uniref:arylamine N-acetyltransferase n=1 Tax=Clavelina lepadiformis TaxID=159417 RepID=A0ABP0G129_CLALP
MMPQRDKERQMDMQKYLQRINYDGPIDNQATTLYELCACHYSHVPFENLDIFGGPRRSMNLDEIYSRVVNKMRGGLCCEGNALFAWLLRKLNFKVEFIQTKLYNKKTDSYDGDLEHMVLLVTCKNDEKFVANISGCSFVRPLALIDMKTQVQRCGAYRLRKETDDVYLIEKMQKKVFNLSGREITGFSSDEDGWQVIQKLEIISRCWLDFKPTFLHIVDKKQSFLSRNTLCTIENDCGIRVLWGMTFYKKEYIDHCTEKVVSVQTAQDEEELKSILKNHFNISIDYNLKPCSPDLKKEELVRMSL